jgi:hypothetical protein
MTNRKVLIPEFILDLIPELIFWEHLRKQGGHENEVYGISKDII